MKAKNRTQSRTALAKASMRNARVAPRKARLVIDQIRGQNVTNALAMLENTRRSSNPIVCKVLKSAIANAVEEYSSIDPDELSITDARVDGARTLKRIRPRAMGRATQVLKRSCHIHLSVG